ncbi:hypothetical protein I3271_00970 [Photobacterium leiognathi]|uniref:hypothetical protein n=1 Tax=Photobacterium leiognathi TaxID=553611 RepID=UPI001EE082AA|nr:hypothetical protein [Photobacterium leiognathi]MCG3883254.1 hypothetical protein [Photobacterium leiognathi]
MNRILRYTPVKPNEFNEAINEIVEAFDDGDLDKMNLPIEQAKNNFEYDFKGYSPHEVIDDMGDLYDWTYEVIDDFMNTANPCAYIYDLSDGMGIKSPLIKQLHQVTGELSDRGIYNIDESRVESGLITAAAYAAVSALNRSETMWDLICNTYNSVAFDPRGANDQYCYNNTFLTTLTSELSEYNLVAAETGRDRDILVIVDFDAIKFYKVIDLTKRLNKESSLELN